MATENQVLLGYIAGVYALMFFMRGVEGILESDTAKIVIWMAGASIVTVVGLIAIRMAPPEDAPEEETDLA